MILVADDNYQLAERHRDLLSRLGYEAAIVPNRPSLSSLLTGVFREAELILLDIPQGDQRNLDLLARIRSDHPFLGVIVTTLLSDYEALVKIIRGGAHNCLRKPLSEDVVKRAIESFRKESPNFIFQDPEFSEFISGSPEVAETLRRAKLFIRDEQPILVLGETGTGKTKLAQHIQGLWGTEGEEREALSFDCAEFAGPKREYTLARFVECLKRVDSVFLVENIAALPIPEQGQLYRFLESSSGSESLRKKRIVVTGPASLYRLVEQGSFDMELFEFLNRRVLLLPPLRERIGDVELLANYFFRIFSQRHGKVISGISGEALGKLSNFIFLNNVRELQHIIELAVVVCQGPQLELQHFPPHIARTPRYSELSLDAVRYRTIMRVLAECDGNQTDAAKILGIARQTLNRMLQRYRPQELGGSVD